ncbi:hypothetical protein DB32_004037 [Sandaracinus amylolyticus]|uniref:Uncharacterized protein n=1 Tax=Sandaracinus amylolyticus TaxID=927083 RepID=A0A0F6YJ31_9BACT|nr:hypothetical protein DB32_004037 [Sandaracinus amylolyticus]
MGDVEHGVLRTRGGVARGPSPESAASGTAGLGKLAKTLRFPAPGQTSGQGGARW